MSRSFEFLLSALETMRTRIAGQVDQADQDSAVASQIIQELAENGFFAMLVPRQYGGAELPLPQFLELCERAAQMDGSVAWAIAIGAGGGTFAAFMPPEEASRHFADVGAVIAGSGMPDGVAVRVPGGYRVSGRWRFASGSRYATLFTANCLVQTDEPYDRSNQPGSFVRAMSFAPSDVELHETWDTLGMRGTGSLDFCVQDVFVPDSASFSPITDEPHCDGPLYKLPFGLVLELSIVAIALGIARAAIRDFACLCAEKFIPGTGDTLRADPACQQAFASACAQLEIASNAHRASARDLWERCVSGGQCDMQGLLLVRAMGVTMVGNLREMMENLSIVAGMSSIDNRQPITRRRRDLATLASHFAVSPRRLNDCGAQLLAALHAGEWHHESRTPSDPAN